MSTDTIAHPTYSDSQMVVATLRSIPNSAPWLGQTTYLVDQSGHTTAVLAQTDRPTVGVTLAPVPYTTQTPTSLPSSIVSSLPSGWAYEGCYNDVTPDERVLSLRQPDNSNLTVQTCVWSCYELGYSISGLENHRQCFCGNAILNGGTLANWDFDCNRSCSGNGTEICGGNDKLSVYSNRTLTTSQSAAAQTSQLTTSTPTIAPTLTGTTPRSPRPVATIAAAVIGAVVGIAIMVVLLILYFRRRTKRNRPRTKFEMQTSHPTQAWPLSDRIPSWEDFMKETEEHHTGLDQSAMLPLERNGSGLGLETSHFGSRFPELRESHERLWHDNQESPHSDWKSSDTYLTPPARYPRRQRGPSRALADQPTSILKRPAPTRTTNTARSRSDHEDEQGSRGIPGTRNLARAKKCVRFGVNQIREFGRSPFIGHGSEP